MNIAKKSGKCIKDKKLVTLDTYDANPNPKIDVLADNPHPQFRALLKKAGDCTPAFMVNN